MKLQEIVTLVLVASFILSPHVAHAQGTQDSSTQTASSSTSSETNTAGSGSSNSSNNRGFACELIDNNWREYGQNILGANQKISDVVLNACVALTGSTTGCRYTSGCRFRKDANGNPVDAEAAARRARGCTPNGGATHSQHLYDNAIDVVPPSGRAAEFIAFAVCGLRRVNNCQGGVGAYTGGSVHIDVRQGMNAIWSNSYGAGSVPNLPDANVREQLYRFANGECTGGTIATNYDTHDERLYGPPITIDTPNNNPFNPQMFSGGFGSYGLPQNWSPAWNGSTGGIGADSGWNSFFDSGSDYSSAPSAGRTDGSSTGSRNSFSDWLGRIQGASEETASTTPQPVTSADGDATVSCERSGLFGTSLFNTCSSATTTETARTNIERAGSTVDQETDTPQGLVAQFLGNTSSVNVGRSAQVATNNTSATGTGARPNTRTGSTPRFFSAVHIPDDTAPESREESYTPGAFVEETRTPNTSNATPISDVFLNDLVLLTTRSVRYGGYLGFVHGFAPIALGSAPTAFIRLGSQALNARTQ